MKHLTRKELIEAARTKIDEFSDHLTKCEECRENVRLLKALIANNQMPLTDAPSSWIQRAEDIILTGGFKERIKRAAKLVFDSWQMPQPAGVRGETAMGSRRLRYESGNVTFDLHAEHQPGEWSFVARISGPPDKPARLKVGSKTLLPDSGGLFQWHLKKPPQKIVILTEQSNIEIPSIKWTKTRNK